MLSDPCRNLLGLAQRAGQVASGEMAAQQALHRRKGALLLLAADASERTARDFAGLARSVGVPCLAAGTRDEMGAAIGKSPRATLVIMSSDFARGLIKHLTPAVPAGSDQRDQGSEGSL